VEEGELPGAGPAGKPAMSAMATGGHTSQSSLAEPPGFSPIRDAASAALPCLRDLCVVLNFTPVCAVVGAFACQDRCWPLHADPALGFSRVVPCPAHSGVSCKIMCTRYYLRDMRGEASATCRSRAGGGPSRERGDAEAPQEAQRSPREGAPGTPGAPREGSRQAAGSQGAGL
jgi:hypothetical protein